ncbi:MAG TPA: ABC transporter substrate-binding protein [Caldilineae bacterium]|nr:ABC transporter substrate-binding protein [Caldilineae bacterium]
MRRTLSIVSLSLTIVLAVMACAPPTAVPAPAEAPQATPMPAEEMPTLKIGTQPWIGYGPWWIAKEKGFFEDHGIHVELIDFVTDQDLNAALAAGQFDGANIATHTSAYLINAGVDLKLVLLEDASFEADAIIAGPGIEAITDLKGKRVAFEEGTTSDLLLSYALMQNGMTKDDIEVVPMPAADAGAAAVAGRVDAAVTYEPYISAALAKGEGYRIIYSAAVKPGLIGDFLAFPQSVLEKKGDQVRAMLLAWQDAIDFLREHPEEGQQIIADAVGSDIEEFKVAWKGIKLYDLAENKEQFAGPIQETYREVMQVLLASGAVESVPDPEDVLDPSYLP